MPSAKPTASAMTTQTFDFTLGPGDESLTMPLGWARPDRVWLIDLRGRHMSLGPVSVDDFTVVGQRYSLSTGEAPTHLRGLPRYFCVREQVMWFWPVPAHTWMGGMSKEKKEKGDGSESC